MAKGFQKLLEGMGWIEEPSVWKYNPAGRLFSIDNKYMSGLYWFYETDKYIMDIHDFFIKEEMVIEKFPDIRPYMSICVSYLVTANGEIFFPYHELLSNTLYVTDGRYGHFRFLLHGNFPFMSVGINFKSSMVKEYQNSGGNQVDVSLLDMFMCTREIATKPIGDIAQSILNCSMATPAANYFFDAKAGEWLSITIDAYQDKKKEKPISPSDDEALENVARYINDHYAMDLPQSLLEKIAMMSGTKLKTLFKRRYGMTITQYIQRRRMNIAENLLLTTNLEIGAIAKAVGYSSHSKFTQYFKKHKGQYPRDIQKSKAQAKVLPHKP